MGDAILQMEFARQRMRDAKINFNYADVEVSELAWAIARGCLNDTIRNGGTFVVVAASDTLTIVQRSTVESMEPRR